MIHVLANVQLIVWKGYAAQVAGVQRLFHLGALAIKLVSSSVLLSYAFLLLLSMLAKMVLTLCLLSFLPPHQHKLLVWSKLFYKDRPAAARLNSSGLHPDIWHHSSY